MDTIYALSTAQGKAGVAIIRVSGPQAFAAAHRLCGDLPPAHRAALRHIRNAAGDVIDEGLVLTFPEKRSFTGEDVVEFQIHGSSAVIRALLGALSHIDGVRMAEAGEFTRRALENGRLDLAQVEGLADLIEAETEAQRVQAARLLSGDLGRLAEDWRKSLIRAVALLEATIDFADEDVPVDVAPEVMHLVSGVRDALAQQISGVQAAERVRAGFEVAIVGAPNVGKSTLLNRLAGRDAAITSEIAGTTRDVIEVRMDLGGLAVTLLDTAGLRETDDAVERIGVDRARSRAAQADLRVYLLSGADNPDPAPLPGDIVLRAKGDLLGGEADAISGKTGLGVSALVGRITEALSDRAAHAGLATHERHRQAMLRGVAALEVALGIIPQGEATAEIAAEELHSAIRALDSLVGRIDIENVLDEIFASFCVGK